MQTETIDATADRNDGWNRARGRWNFLLHIALFVPTVLLFVFLVVGVMTVTSLIGIVILAAALPASRGLANIQRRDAAALLREPVPSPYRADLKPGFLGLRRVRDPQTWRDLLWLLVSMTVGFTLSITALSLLLAIPWYAAGPLWIGLSDEVFDYGIIHLESVTDGFLGWGVAVLFGWLWWHGAPWIMWARAKIDQWLLGVSEGERARRLKQRVEVLADSRSDAVDIQAAELRRIERDLHDGAQARLVSSGMTVGMAIEAMDSDPAAAKAMLHEARATTQDALADLRRVVRGIHPPVLADRGLVGAVQAIAEQMTPRVEVASSLPGRPPAPVESAAYFAVAECLANVGKHSHASTVTVRFWHEPAPPGQPGILRVTVEDNGVGGARLDPEGGLGGIARRLAVFDGTLEMSSPTGGPTLVTITVPCLLTG